ncbi:unnamed protein product [Choristocarpus tenellus]
MLQIPELATTFHTMTRDIWDAVRREDIEVIRDLICSPGGGVSVNERNDLGETPLLLAAGLGLEFVVQILLDIGADVHVKDWESGWTPLHRSLYSGHLRVSLHLLENGAVLGDCSDDEALDPSVKSGTRHRSHSTLRDFNGNGRAVTRARCGFRDNDGNSALDVLSLQLRSNLATATTAGHGGDVYSFGKADFFLGYDLPNASDVIRPRRVESLANLQVVCVAASRYHSVAVTLGGKVFTWGHGRSGRLGHGDEGVRILPTLVEGLSHKMAVGVAAAENHTVALTSDGLLYTWGSNRFGQLGHGGSHGGNVGRVSATVTGVRLSPKRVEGLRKVNVVQVATGAGHTAAVTSQGMVYTWGRNNHRQLGYDGTAQTITPKIVSALTSTASRGSGMARQKIIKISAAANSTVVVAHGIDKGLGRRPTNEVYQWGHGSHFPNRVNFNNTKSGIERDSSVRWQTHDARVNIIDVSAAKYHNVALSSAGQVFTWGFGTDNLGLDPPEARTARGPQLVAAMLPENSGGNAVFVSASDRHTCVVTDTGDLFTWGSADGGGNTLGHGGERWQPVAKRVSGLKKVAQVAAAPEHTVVLLVASCPPLPHLASSKHVFESKQVEDEEDMEHEPEEDDRADGFDSQLSSLESGLFLDVNGDSNDDSMSLLLNVEDPIVGETCVLDSCPHSSEVLTLKQLCEVVLAREVDLRNAPSILAYADVLDAPALASFCAEFVRQNLDAILVLASETDRKCLLEATGEQVRSMFDTHKARNLNALLAEESKGSEGPVAEDLREEEGINREAMAAAMARTERRGNTPSTKAAERAIRSLKKKIARIAELESLKNSGRSLSADQLQKVSLRPSMEAELDMLEPVLERAKLAQLAKSHRLKRGDGEDAKPLTLFSEVNRDLEGAMNDHLQEGTSVITSKQAGSDVGSSFNFSHTLDLSLDIDEVPKPRRCEACQVECANGTVYAQHLRGKRHRLCMAKLEKQLHDEARSQVTNFDQDSQESSAPGSATTSTFALPQSYQDPHKGMRSQCRERRASCPEDNVKSASATRSKGRGLEIPSTHMQEGKLRSDLERDQRASLLAGGLQMCVRHIHETSPGSGMPITPQPTNQQAYSLLEFLSASKSRQPLKQKKSAAKEKESQVSRGWDVATGEIRGITQGVARGTPTRAMSQDLAVSMPSTKAKSLSKIMEEEEREKTQREEYGISAWFVSRKPRSTSFEGIVQQQRQEAHAAEDRRARELEEVKEDEMLRLVLEMSKNEAKPNQKSARKDNFKKKQRGKKREAVKKSSGHGQGSNRKGGAEDNHRSPQGGDGGNESSRGQSKGLSGKSETGAQGGAGGVRRQGDRRRQQSRKSSGDARPDRPSQV